MSRNCLKEHTGTFCGGHRTTSETSFLKEKKKGFIGFLLKLPLKVAKRKSKKMSFKTTSKNSGLEALGKTPTKFTNLRGGKAKQPLKVAVLEAVVASCL